MASPTSWARCSVAPWPAALLVAPLRVGVTSRRNPAPDPPPQRPVLTASIDIDDYCPLEECKIHLPDQCGQSYYVWGSSRVSFAPHQRRSIRMPVRGVRIQDVRQACHRLPCAPEAPRDCYRVPRVRSPLLQAAGGGRII